MMQRNALWWRGGLVRFSALVALSTLGGSGEALAKPATTFRDLLAQAKPAPGPGGSLLERIFPNCKDAADEFKKRRCEKSKRLLTREAIGETFCSIAPATLGTYDFRRQAFPVIPHPHLGDPWATPYDSARAKRDGYIADDRPEHAVIMVSGPGAIRKLDPIEDPRLSKRRWFSIDPDAAESLRETNALVTVSVFRPVRIWRRKARTGADVIANKLCRKMVKEIAGVDRKIARKARRECKVSTTIVGIKAKLVARAVIDLTSGEVLYSSRRFGSKDDLADDLSRCGPANPGGGVLLEGAKEETEEAAAGNMSKEEAAEKAVAMMEGMAEAVKSNAEDCGAMGDSLQKIIDENKEFMEQTKEFDKDPETRKWFDENHGPKMMEIMGGMMEGLQKCAENEKVKAAMQSLEG